MRYIYYRKVDKFKERIILIRKDAKAAMEEAKKYGDGLIMEAPEEPCPSVEALILWAESKIIAKQYVTVEGIVNGSHSKTGRDKVKTINNASYQNALANSRRRGGFRSAGSGSSK